MKALNREKMRLCLLLHLRGYFSASQLSVMLAIIYEPMKGHGALIQ